MNQKKSKSTKKTINKTKSMVNVGEKELSREEYNTKLKKLIDKISFALSQKFTSLFKEKAYYQNQLNSDLSKLCADVDFNSLEYTLYFMDIERKILTKISKLPYVAHKGVPEKNKVNFLTEPLTKTQLVLNKNPSDKETPKLKNESKNGKNEEKAGINKAVFSTCGHVKSSLKRDSNKSQISQVVLNEDEETILQRALRKEKVNKLKTKENDEWALIAKYNHYKLCVEKRNMLLKEKEQRQSLTSSLQRQLSEKEFAKRNLKALEQKFFEEQIKMIKTAEEEESKQVQTKKEKMLKEKEYLENILRANVEQKEKDKVEEKNKDITIIERVKEEIKTEEQKIVDKKLKEKERFWEMEKENKEKTEKKKKIIEEEKNLDKKCQEEYTRFLDKQDEERERLSKSIKDKFLNSNGKIEIEKVKKSSQVIENYENNKYLKEKENIEKKEKDEESIKNAKKKEMIDQMKETLNKQIEEKRKRIDLDKEYHSRFSKEVVDKSVETFKSEQMDNENKNKLVIQKYKEELDRQILEKKQNVLGSMNNTEKDYNKRLLSEILSSPMLVKE